MRGWRVGIVIVLGMLLAVLVPAHGTSARVGPGIEFSDPFWWQPCSPSGGVGITAHYEVPLGFTIRQTFNDHDPVWGDGSGVWEWATTAPLYYDYTGQWMGVPAGGWARFTVEVFDLNHDKVSTTTVYGSCATGQLWVSYGNNRPGCDLLPIPETAVVGSFTNNAEVFWAPGQPVTPTTVINAGNTAWVLGVDASSQYYKIIWSCDYLWVPVSSMGPNYDDVWQGRPLPAEVVK